MDFLFSILDIILAFFLYVKMGRRHGVVAVVFFMLEIALALFFSTSSWREVMVQYQFSIVLLS